MLRPLRVFRPVRVVWLGLLGATGCGGTRSGIEQSSAWNAPSPGKVITADAIAASGARTAWDAVRLTVPNVQLREVRGQPTRIQRRGRASIYLDDQVRVVLDHMHVDDLQVLKQVPATDILTMEVLTGIEATTYFGTSSPSGVIVITTKSGGP